MVILGQTEATNLRVKNFLKAAESRDGDQGFKGYQAIYEWLEGCGKDCNSTGMHCEQQPSTAEECAAKCDAEKTCKGFQNPGDNGLCVWMDYTVEKTHYCHNNKTFFVKSSSWISCPGNRYTLKNRNHNEYMYVGASEFDADNKYVLTWGGKTDTSDDSYCFEIDH